MSNVVHEQLIGKVGRCYACVEMRAHDVDLILCFFVAPTRDFTGTVHARSHCCACVKTRAPNVDLELGTFGCANERFHGDCSCMELGNF